MRGQSAIEYVLIVALAVGILTPFIYYGYMSSQESSRIMQARRAVEALASAADHVYAQGTGSRTLVSVYVPGGVNFTASYIGKPSTAGPSVESKEIGLKVSTRAGETDVFATTIPEVRGSWLNHSGMQVFTVYMTEDGFVLVTPYELEFDAVPSYFSYNIKRGSVQEFNFTLVSLSDYNLNVNLSKTGTVGGWITLSQDSVNLSAGSSVVVYGNISIPTTASYGLNTGKIVAESANSSRDILFEITVYSEGGVLCNSTHVIVRFYHNSSYSTQDYIFRIGSPVIITGAGWEPYSTLTIDIKNPSNNSVTGYPKTLTASANGTVSDSWDPALQPSGNYTVYLNDSSTTTTTTFEVLPCS